MKFGVDFGTTRTTVALVDRGNYPLVSFIDPSGDDHDYVPSVIALGEEGLLFGFEAEDAALEGAPICDPSSACSPIPSCPRHRRSVSPTATTPSSNSSPASSPTSPT